MSEKSSEGIPGTFHAGTFHAGTFRVAALQMVSAPDRERNIAEAGRLIAEAARDGAQLVLLPEYFCYMGFKDTDKLAIRETPGHGPIQQFLADAAREHRVWVIGGTLPLESPEAARVLNTTLVFDPTGKQVARYDKIHLFNFEKGTESFDEARTICPGSEVRTFDAPFGRVGLSVCYDLRFPELYRKMGDCALMHVAVRTTYTTGEARREALLKARAVENQCYVAGLRAWRQTRKRPPDLGAQHADRPMGRSRGRGGRRCGRRRPDPLMLRTCIASVRQSLPALRHRVLG